MARPILVSGIQPTGRLHIGNYLGAMRQFVTMQEEDQYSLLFFVADYHALTVYRDPKERVEQMKNLLRMYLAAGIDPKKSTLFVQSDIPAHTELAWILGTVTPFGDLSRMTQFKEKSQQNATNINAGLFFYPVLMAADVLLYNAEVVPVGEDQVQHLELARTVARKFNKTFGDTFIEPKPFLTKAARIMSLDDPTSKMSKSRPAGCLFLDDAPEDIRKKIMRAVTDSGDEIRYDPKKKPAVSNLLHVFAALTDTTPEQVATEHKQSSYKEFKETLAEVVVEALEPFRSFTISDAELKKVIASGNKYAQTLASKKLKEVKQKIGFSGI